MSRRAPCRERPAGGAGILGRYRLRSASALVTGPVGVLRVNAALLETASPQRRLDFQRVLIGTLIERRVDPPEALAAKP
jgi:hypothetical protein